MELGLRAHQQMNRVAACWQVALFGGICTADPRGLNRFGIPRYCLHPTSVRSKSAARLVRTAACSTDWGMQKFRLCHMDGGDDRKLDSTNAPCRIAMQSAGGGHATGVI